MDGRPNRRNKAAFSNFSVEVWNGPQSNIRGIPTSFRDLGLFDVVSMIYFAHRKREKLR